MSFESFLNVVRSLPEILLQLIIFDFSREDFSLVTKGLAKIRNKI